MQNLSTFWKEYKQLDNNPLTKQTGSSKQNRTKPKNSIPVHPFRSRDSKPWWRRCLWTMLVGAELSLFKSTAPGSTQIHVKYNLVLHVKYNLDLSRSTCPQGTKLQVFTAECPGLRSWNSCRESMASGTNTTYAKVVSKVGTGDSAIWSKLINKTIETRQPFWSLPCLCILDLLGSLLCRL